MLAVKPIPDLSVAKELCDFCGVPFSGEAFTYFAADVNENDTKINYIIGVCTFTMRGGVCRIDYLTPADGIDDEEAMIIMARTVMNFMYRCEAERVTASVDGIGTDMVKKLGFKQEADEYYIDLKKFYEAPCKY